MIGSASGRKDFYHQFALESHSELLGRGGFLVDEVLLAHRPIPKGPLMTIFPSHVKWQVLRPVAEEIYKKDQVRGSDDKTGARC